MDADVLVMGGGYAGLSVGALLSARGLSVLLLEKSSQLGGRAGYTEKDGYLLEYGLHANRFASQGAAAEVFRRLGRELVFLPVGEPELWWKGEFHPLPNAVPKILKTPLLSIPARAEAVVHLLKLVTLPTGRLYARSLQEVTGGCRREEVRTLLRVLSGIGIIAPELENASAGEFAAFLRKALRAREKVGYPRGGTRTIIQGLQEELERNGEVRTGTAVTGMVARKGLVEAVEAGGESFSAKAVVCAIPLRKVPDLLGERDLPVDFVRKARVMEPTSGICLDLGLRDRISDKTGLLVTAEPLTMGQFTSNIDPSAAPAGKQLLSWFYPLPFRVFSDREALKAEEVRLRATLREMFPGLWESVEWERCMRLEMVDGFLPNPRQSLPFRPGFTVSTLENFFLCGDATAAPGTGGDTAFNSALAVADLVVDYLRRNNTS
jgi:phytoene dehydrogenase-like protein